MKFDDILINYIGEFGRYQIFQFVLVCLPAMFTAMHALSWTFTGASIPHRCLVVGENESNAFPFLPIDDTYLKWVYENKSDGNGKISQPCRRPIGVNVFNWTFPENMTKEDLETCDAGGLYKWDYTEIPYSAISRWEIICSRSWIKAFVQSMYYVGQFFGSLVFGILADRYGRKNVFFTAITLQVACGTIMAFIPWWPLFAIFRIGVGFAHPGIFLIAVVIGMELVGPSRRVVAGVATGIFFAFGQIILATLAYNIRYYNYLQLAVSLPALLFFVYWWIVPESARWLISQKRFQEADKILQHAAKFNKKTLPPNWYEQLDEESSPTPAGTQVKKYGFFDLFKTPNIRKRACIAAFICWPTVSMAYYGLSMNPNFLGGDRYVTFLIGAFLELPAMIIVLFTMNILGRKTLCMGGFLSAALCLLITLAIPEDYPTLLSIMVVLGKMSLTAVYAIIYVYTPELFPTVIRSTAMGTCSMVARVGAVSASYIAMWLVDVSKVAVVLIFGGMCLVAGASTLLLPETTGQAQFETIEDAEKFGRNQPLFVFSFRAKSDQLKVVKDGNETQEALMQGDEKAKAL